MKWRQNTLQELQPHLLDHSSMSRSLNHQVFLRNLFLARHHHPLMSNRPGQPISVTDEDSRGLRYVKFWVDDTPSSPAEGRASSLGGGAPSRVSYPHTPLPPFPSLGARDGGRVPTSPERRDRPPLDQSGPDRGHGSGSPDSGGGARFDDDEAYEMGHIPEGARSQTRTPQTPRIPPEDNVP